MRLFLNIRWYSIPGIMGFMLLADHAHAVLSAQEKEDAHSMVMILQVASLFAAVAVMVAVWVISKRSSNQRKSQLRDRQENQE